MTVNRNRKSDAGFTAPIVMTKIKSENLFWRPFLPHAPWEDLQTHTTNAR
jgi:hypothetical protein